MAQLNIEGITLNCDDSGDGWDAVLLIHGHPFDRTLWRPQIDAIARSGWRAITPDLRGYGQSLVVPGPFAFEAFGKDLLGLMDRLALERFIVCGLSMGGQVAMDLCRQAPDRVRGAIFAATFEQSETLDGKRRRQQTADRLLSEGMGSYAEETLPKMLARRSSETLPVTAEHVLSMMRSAPPVGAAAALRARAERPDYAATLEALRVPVLIIVGDEDAFTTRQDAERMRALARSSELLWMPGVGHLPNLERPEDFNQALLGLLRRVSRASGPTEAPR